MYLCVAKPRLDSIFCVFFIQKSIGELELPLFFFQTCLQTCCLQTDCLQLFANSPASELAPEAG